jgi:hypothetical protein
MTIKVCSGFSQAGYVEYGTRFLETFDAHWPQTIALEVFTEAKVEMPRGSCRSLWECKGVGNFIDRHKRILAHNGREPNQFWRDKHRVRGYHYKFDAVKFCRQCFIPEKASEGMADGDILVWLDADVVTFNDIPKGFVEKLIGDADIAFLGRERFHTELGFWAVRINARTREFLFQFADIWRTDRVFSLPEWHSAFVFDHCRRKAGLNERNLTPKGSGHVWFQSPLRHYTDHCKGERKSLGYSPERSKA